MASGLPIIAERTGGVPAIVSEQNGILIDPESVPEIMKAIVEMKNNPEMRKEMAIKNRKKARENYSWKRVAEMYQEIYSQTDCIEPQGRRPVLPALSCITRQKTPSP